MAIFGAVILASLPPAPPRTAVAETAALSVMAPSYEAPPPADLPSPPAPTDAAPIEVKLPSLAYTYRLGFRLAGDRLAEVQDAHRALCTGMGPARCQLIAMARGVEGDTQTPAKLTLRVASADAKGFGERLSRIVSQRGGKTVATSIAAEDVSKDIVDAEARIRQRELLVSRLTEILRTRRGTVGELVEAERSVATAQEELDQTKGWLAELRGRVAMSNFEIGYSAVTPPPAVVPDSEGGSLLDALRGSIGGFLTGLRILLMMLIYLTPWVLIGVPVGLWIRRMARRKAERETLLAGGDA
ncbi:DUF4349 domain-containing protein [Sphingomonas sp. AOB5]|uniref:DUF4349 domain-containing protein n=1 Tax=Sphingomonas sp. AOB5 TaxID=3034017 RepID=UPI0023F9A25C|nr:DUF4349 domain-containing protein [Sphingomonas sp. AOB5]MDF7775679.1 DUF4349 domain-containing protein [Sphingomonas sp. AOB5]